MKQELRIKYESTNRWPKPVQMGLSQYGRAASLRLAALVGTPDSGVKSFFGPALGAPLVQARAECGSPHLEQMCLKRQRVYLHLPALNSWQYSPVDGLPVSVGERDSLLRRLANESKADSTALTLDGSSGSGSAWSGHSFVPWAELRHSSHLDSCWDLPVKQMEYKVGLICDQRLFSVRAAWRQNAASYLTQARP